jgi:phage tail-like protein
MPTGKRTDPLVSPNFYLDVGGKVTGLFKECSGIGSESEVVEHKVVDKGGVPVVMKVPGPLKWQNVVLKRGVTNDMEIWNWRKKIEDGNVKEARMDCSITMYDQVTQKEVARWNFFSAWPVKVSGPSLNAGTNEIAVEELTIAHELMKRVK